MTNLRDALELLVKDVEGYPAWERPCHALDVAKAALERTAPEGGERVDEVEQFKRWWKTVDGPYAMVDVAWLAWQARASLTPAAPLEAVIGWMVAYKDRMPQRLLIEHGYKVEPILSEQSLTSSHKEAK